MSDVVTELRKIAATLASPAQVQTLLYAADLLEPHVRHKDQEDLICVKM